MAEPLYALTAEQVRKINADRAALRDLLNRQPGTSPISVNVAQIVKVTSRIKVGDYFPAAIYASADDHVGEDVYLWYAGPIETLGTEVLAVRTGFGIDRVVFKGPYNPPPFLFPAQLTARDGASAPYRYSWTEFEYTDSFAIISKPGGRTGKLKAHAAVVQTQIANGTSLHDIFMLFVTGDEDGNYKTTFDGGSPSTFAHDAAPVIAGTTITGSLGTYTITPTDFLTHTLTVDESGLLPSNPSNPAITVANGALKVPLMVHLMEAGGAPSICEIQSIVTGDPKATPPVAQQFSLKIRNVIDGWYKGSFQSPKLPGGGVGPSARIRWNAAASDIQSALSAILPCTVARAAAGTSGDFVVTVTQDNEPYDATTDPSDLRSTQDFVVVSGFGDACLGAFGGIDPATIPGYDATATRQYLILGSGCVQLVTPGTC